MVSTVIIQLNIKGKNMKEDDNDKRVDWGFISSVVIFVLCIILFNGDPDISDSLRIVVDKWANS